MRTDVGIIDLGRGDTIFRMTMLSMSLLFPLDLCCPSLTLGRQQREDMKHATVKMLCGGELFFAPVGQSPQEILDIGTGTGIWAIESE